MAVVKESDRLRYDNTTLKKQLCNIAKMGRMDDHFKGKSTGSDPLVGRNRVVKRDR